MSSKIWENVKMVTTKRKNPNGPEDDAPQDDHDDEHSNECQSSPAKIISTFTGCLCYLYFLLKILARA